MQDTYTWGIRVRNEPLATPNYTPGHWGEAVQAAGTMVGPNAACGEPIRISFGGMISVTYVVHM